MKKRSFAFLCVFLAALFALPACAGADAPDREEMAGYYEAMTIGELEETREDLERILNEKRLEGATLSLTGNATDVAVNRTLKLTPVCDGRTLNAKTKYAYESSDPTIATVTNGTVTGKKAGRAVIRLAATFEDGAVLRAEYEVRVIVPVTQVKAPAQKVTALVGMTTDLSAMVSVLPANATEQGLKYESSDPKVATVDKNGVLTGVKAGKVTVTVTSKENTTQPKTAKINVTVDQPVRGISLSAASIDIGKGKTMPLTATVTPSDATNKQVTWTSADPKIASVAANGTVRGVGTGTTTVTCTAKDGSGASASVKVTVTQQITGIKASNNKTKVGVKAGDSTRVSVTVTPADATNKTLEWTCSNNAVAAITDSRAGSVTIKGLKTGTAKVTGKATDGSGKSVTLTVTVEGDYAAELTGYGNKGTSSGYRWFTVQVKNTSAYRTIDRVTLRYSARDAYGNKMKSYGYGDEYVEETLSVTIAPGMKKTTPKAYAYSFANATRIFISIAAVHYTDGTSAPAPSYNYYYWEY